MKNILLPTDFSPNARAAALFGAALARHTRARLVLFHVLQDKEQGLEEITAEEWAQNQLDILAGELLSLYQISITRLVKPGFVVDEVLSLAGILQADLILIGARGATQLLGETLGAFASELIHISKYPLVCLPSGAQLSLQDELKTLMAENNRYSNTAGMQLLQQLALPAGAEQFPVK